jgi:hypothetical protein
VAVKRSKHGGARPNQTGRPKKVKPDYDEKFKKEVIRTLNKLKREHNKKSFLEAALEMMWDKKVQDTVKASLLKTYADIFAVKKAETKLDVNPVTGPGILLPEENPDPSEEIG